MAAKIIAVVNQKGGSGKTTVSMQLAGALARRWNKV
jgi:chromosome partitioning protein